MKLKLCWGRTLHHTPKNLLQPAIITSKGITLDADNVLVYLSKHLTVIYMSWNTFNPPPSLPSFIDAEPNGFGNFTWYIAFSIVIWNLRRKNISELEIICIFMYPLWHYPMLMRQMDRLINNKNIIEPDISNNIFFFTRPFSCQYLNLITTKTHVWCGMCPFRILDRSNCLNV